MILIDPFVIFSVLVITSLIIPIVYTFNLYFRIKVIEFFIFGGFFLFSAFFYAFVLLAYSYDKLIYYQLERFFLISSYWFLLILINKIKKGEWIYKLFTSILFVYSLVLLGLVTLWEKGRQPDTGNIFGIIIDPIENVPYHPQGANMSIDRIDLIYGTSFPLLNTIYMLLVSAFLLYTFSTTNLHVKTNRTIRAKKLWKIALSLHLSWVIFALPWIGLGRAFQIINVISTILIVIIIVFYPEGLILSKSQIMATYRLYDKLSEFEGLREKRANIANLAVENIMDYISSIPSDILELSKETRKI